MTNIGLICLGRKKTKRSENVESLGLGESSENEYEMVSYQTFSLLSRRATLCDDTRSQEPDEVPR